MVTRHVETLESWVQRELLLSMCIITHLAQEKEFPLAIVLLQDMLLKNSQNIHLLSTLGRIHLQVTTPKNFPPFSLSQLGNMKAAAALFKQIEVLEKSVETSILCNMNRGYLSLSMDQYNNAVENFQAVLNLDANNIVAANNKAICLLYKCEMTEATNILEEIIKRDPERNLHETIVFNLCTLYDLASDNSTEKKKSIMNLVAKFGSDSFDFSVLKLTNE